MNWPIRLRRVGGVSLMPAIRPGKVIVFVRPRRLQVGQLVLAQANGQEIIKLITTKEGGYCRLVGALAGSASYRVAEGAILGVAVGYNNAYESTRRPTG